MAALEAAVRGIETDGLVWGSSKLVPVGFGIKKLQINLVVEDEKISLADLEEQIQGFEDYVQSTDIVSFECLVEIPLGMLIEYNRPLCRSCKPYLSKGSVAVPAFDE